ncbi:uncharacterized protein FTJAE_3723 [Fusarium tjaetaba]|uniref:Uncharacterized protein n=1 Tax=Fusarium tjaetaba TaxID=1567544 RepID=A0A8H5S068_9HYPO|nr:uncharacterized protein FTJAE_3723 [Fusarium tjaetaba]KAF5642248.1 hypothetical protein FTJAE_3723 [Fusarium tjaetaba]
MCSDFLADINNNHARESLGQLLLITRCDLDVPTLEVPGSYDSRGRLLTIGEKVQICSRLYLDAFAASEQSLDKLSKTAGELAHTRGSLHRVTELFRKYNPAVSVSAFHEEWKRVADCFNNAKQQASASIECWTHLLYFIQQFKGLIDEMITDNKKSSIRLIATLEDAKAEIESRRHNIDRESQAQKDTQRFDFTYAVPLLITVFLVLFLPGLFLNTMILSAMFLCALLILREGVQSSYGATLTDDNGDQSRDLEVEIERLTCKQKRNAAIGETLQEIGTSLASAIGGVREIHDSYRAVSERLNSMSLEKIGRFERTMRNVSDMISGDESYLHNRPTHHQPRESKHVTELRELAVELRLTFYIMFEWSSIENTTIPPAYSANSDVYFAQPSSQGFKDTLTLNEVAGIAEIELDKLYRKAPGKRDKLGTGEGDRGIYYDYANSS